MQILAAIVALIKAVPIFDKWMERLFVAYKAWVREQSFKQNKDGIDAAIKEHDQRKLEDAYGHPNPGAPSGDSGAVVRPTPARGLPNEEAGSR